MKFWQTAATFFLTLLFAAAVMLPERAGAAEKRVCELRETANHLEISIKYPAFGIPAVDEAVKRWAEQLAAHFHSEFSAEAQAETHVPYQLQADYDVIRVPGGVLGILWRVYSYTAGTHGALALVSACYLPESGKAVVLQELFGNPEAALGIISATARQDLEQKLGDMLQPETLHTGTLPEPDNFSTFMLTATALRIFFQPYQVAPWAAGPQHVDIPLEKLSPAAPRLRLWGKESPPER